MKSDDDKEGYADVVMYLYDVANQKLQEQGVLPLDDEAEHAFARYSKMNDKAYYSNQVIEQNESSYTQIWEYDFSTKKTQLLDKVKNQSFSGIEVIGDNKLLGMKESRNHPLTPALFDLKTKTYTYMFDVNKEEESLYNYAPVYAQYNPNTEEIICAYQNNDEAHSDRYMDGNKSIATYIAIASKDLLKDKERIYPLNLKAGDQVTYVTQISKNECMVQVSHYNESKSDMEDIFYDIKFNGDKSEVMKVDNIYPDSYGGVMIDGGDNYYFNLYKDNKTVLYCYNAESGGA